MSGYHGSKTMADGSRVAMSGEEAKAMWEMVETAQKDRAQRLPDAYACLAALSSAKERLRELGWRETTYCPRDGSEFAVCELGSTGMWIGFFSSPYIHYADCVGSPSKSMFFKPLGKLDADEKATLEKSTQAVIDEINRLGEMYS